MNSIQIEYFLALAKNLSFSDTAREIHVSQPAISKQILSLERETGVVLFERGYRNLKLTIAGKMLYDFFERTNLEYNAIINEISKNSSSLNSKIRLGCVCGISVESLPKAISNFQKDYPEYNFHLEHRHFQELYGSLEGGDLDIIITLMNEIKNRPNIIWRTLEITNPMLVMSNMNPLSRKEEITIESLKNETFLALDPTCSPASGKLIYALCQTHGFMPRNLVYCLSNESIRLSVESGIGIALMHESVLNLGSTEKVRWFKTNIPAPVVAAWKRTTENRFVEVFVQELLRHVEKYKN